MATRHYPAGATSVVPVTITLAAEAGFTITARLDGVNLPLGATTVTATGYHEVYETKVNTATNAVSVSLAFQFIIPGPGRGTTEMGLPVSQPWPFVNDAPAAFAGQVLEVIVPPRYPLNLPVPVAVRLMKGAGAGAAAAAGDPLFLNGRVGSQSYPSHGIQVKRGWGSTVLPPGRQAGPLGYAGELNGLQDAAPIDYEPSTMWVNQGGNLTGVEAWAENSRIHLKATITVKAGATLTVGPGTVIRAASGTEIWVEPGGTVLMNGTLTDPTQVRSLTLELLADDGAVAFINGVAFPPVNIDPGTAVGGVSGIGADQLATSTKGDGAGEITYDLLGADSSILSALTPGLNMLALEVHQGSTGATAKSCSFSR